MQRLDQLLVNKGLAASRTLAQKLIKENCVEVKLNGLWKINNKPSVNFSPDTEIRIKSNELQRYVSRAGLKLEGALERIQLDVTNLTVLDIGQSTGGFTDCILQRGARKVIGVDVGHDQLHSKIKSDTRVICLEGLNARELNPKHLGDTANQIDLVVMDLSFISQSLVLPRVAELINPSLKLVSLVKPQFEVGRDKIGKGGLVKDKTLYEKVQTTICEQIKKLDFEIKDYFQSSIEGGDGNTEFFVYAVRTDQNN